MTMLNRVKRKTKIYNERLATKIIKEIEDELVKNNGYCEMAIYNSVVMDMVFDILLEEGFELRQSYQKITVRLPDEDE